MAQTDEPNARRMVRAYGTRLDRILGDARTPDALGEWFGEELTSAEVRHLMRHEFAETADDVLWRRSKLGLHLDAGAQAGLARFMENGDGRAAARGHGNHDVAVLLKEAEVGREGDAGAGRGQLDPTNEARGGLARADDGDVELAVELAV